MIYFFEGYIEGEQLRSVEQLSGGRGRIGAVVGYDRVLGTVHCSREGRTYFLLFDEW